MAELYKTIKGSKNRKIHLNSIYKLFKRNNQKCNQLYYGNLIKYIYAGCAGNIFGVEHNEIIEPGVYFLKIKDHEYIELSEFLSNKKKKIILRDFATYKGELFVGNLILVNNLIERSSL